MSGIIRTAIHTFAALGLAGSLTLGWAQEPKQIKLTEKHVEAFIAAQQDMSAVVQKIQADATARTDSSYDAELEAVTKKHGFNSFAEYEDVAATISIVMASIDPQNIVQEKWDRVGRIKRLTCLLGVFLKNFIGRSTIQAE